MGVGTQFTTIFLSFFGIPYLVSSVRSLFFAYSQGLPQWNGPDYTHYQGGLHPYACAHMEVI